jgi:hypothetical protein
LHECIATEHHHEVAATRPLREQASQGFFEIVRLRDPHRAEAHRWPKPLQEDAERLERLAVLEPDSTAGAIASRGRLATRTDAWVLVEKGLEREADGALAGEIVWPRPPGSALLGEARSVYECIDKLRTIFQGTGVFVIVRRRSPFDPLDASVIVCTVYVEIYGPPPKQGDADRSFAAAQDESASVRTPLPRSSYGRMITQH